MHVGELRMKLLLAAHKTEQAMARPLLFQVPETFLVKSDRP